VLLLPAPEESDYSVGSSVNLLVPPRYNFTSAQLPEWLKLVTIPAPAPTDVALGFESNGTANETTGDGDNREGGGGQPGEQEQRLVGDEIPQTARGPIELLLFADTGESFYWLLEVLNRAPQVVEGADPLPAELVARVGEEFSYTFDPWPYFFDADGDEVSLPLP